ncbi:MAG: iron-containing alcohol dehydrogenase [Bacilli bacterium]|nr:iron-containing alcohol dehydrogenase [Bacilli bacterium]
MIDFDFIAPTKIFFGKGKENKIGEIVRDYGFDNVLIIIGQGSVKRSGLLSLVEEKLSQEGIKYSLLSDVRPNPEITKVKEGIRIAKKEGTTLLLAVGGGSVIDTAKSIAAGFYYERDPFDFNLHKAAPTKALPIGVILTISAAGSEMSNSCVISNDETKIKYGFNSDVIRPLFAIENPELTYSVSKYQTACGIVDIMAHSLERYFNQSEPGLLSDDLALDVIKNVMVNGKKAFDNPNDYEARAAMMLDSSLSHNGLTSLGKNAPFIVHPIEHALSGYKTDIAHGAGIALLYPAWCEYVYKKDVVRFAKMARRLFDIVGTDDEKTAIIGIRSLRKFFNELGMPSSLNDVGLGKEDIDALVSIASGNGTRVIGRYPQSLDKKDVQAIFESLVL